MKYKLRKAAALLLVLTLLTLCCANAFAAAVPYGDIEYTRPELEIFTEYENLIKAKSSDADNASEVYELFASMRKALDEYDTMMSYAMINCYADLSNQYWAGEYSYLASGWSAASSSVISAARIIIDSPCGKSASEYWDSTTISRAVYNKTYTPHQLELLTKESELLASYRQLLTEETGREELAQIYISLINVRNSIADAMGYSTYSEYAYAEMYSRDYTPADAAEFSKMVKAYVVPVFTGMFDGYTDSAERLSEYFSTRTASQLLSAIKTPVSEISPSIALALDNMLTLGYYDVAQSESKANSSFTTMLSDYEMPYMFVSPDSSPYDLITLSHELGHYLHYSIYPVSSWYSATPLDVAEIHSTGLQLLLSDKYANIVGTVNEGPMQRYTLFQSMYALISGCLYDEFQQRVYALKDPTAQAIEDIFADVMQAYGLSERSNMHWTSVSHNFDQPFYYISYSVSAASAWELWLMAREDSSAAANAYLRTVVAGYGRTRSATLAVSGLGDPMDASFAKNLCRRLDAWFDYGSQFIDIENHWALDIIKQADELDLFNGSGSYEFKPDSTMTRAMFVTVLGRLFAPEDPVGTSDYTDVSPEDYFAEWVCWANGAGVITGYDDGTFRPHEAITRQEMAVMMARACAWAGIDLEAGETVFEDESSVAAWASDAVGALAGAGVLTGKPDGSFCPTATATRAEAAAAFVRLSAIVK